MSVYLSCVPGSGAGGPVVRTSGEVCAGGMRVAIDARARARCTRTGWTRADGAMMMVARTGGGTGEWGGAFVCVT